MRRYTATQDELREYIGLTQEIERTKADLDGALKAAEALQQSVEAHRQAVASAEGRLAEWDQAHGEDIPDA